MNEVPLDFDVNLDVDGQGIVGQGDDAQRIDGFAPAWSPGVWGVAQGMDRIRVRGGIPLHGAIQVAGAKNAALPIMAASLLAREPLALENVPRLADITSMLRLLHQHGAGSHEEEERGEAGDEGRRTVTLDAAEITSTRAPYDIVRKMRASVLVLGPLLARCGEAEVSMPGGCAIGSRPVDLHVHGLVALGATIAVENGYIHASAPKGLKGARIVIPRVSVGATENILMAATLAHGETVIENAAREPEIGDLARCLVAMGARIEGIGTDCLRIAGVPVLHGARYAVMADRIETGTYALAAAATRGDVVLEGARIADIEALAHVLARAGVWVRATPAGVRVRASGGVAGVDVVTEPFPGFPTDLQAQTMALMATAHGAAVITETIFENRFMHVPELRRMGADIALNGGTATVRGVARLTGAPVMASDLRASASLIVAGLIADGETEIHRVYHLDRGYERLVDKLAAVGADLERVPGAG